MRYFDFFQWAWPILNPGQPLHVNWHIEYLCEAMQESLDRLMANLEKTQDLIINVPPATGKSSIVSQMAHPWLWTKRPELRIIGASYNLALSTSHALRSRDLLTSDEYRERWGTVFNLRKDRAKAAAYANNRTGERISTSTGAGITGRHAHLLLIDDPLHPGLAATRKGLEKCIQWYDGMLSTRMVDRRTALRIIVMQRLHESDLSGYLLKRRPEAYHHICLPAEVTPAIRPYPLHDLYEGGLLDADRLSRKVLDDLRGDLGAWAYAGQMLQAPAPIDGGLLKRRWFGTCQSLPEDAVWNLVIDPAYTKEGRNDPSGLMAYAYHDGYWYIRSAEAVRLEFPNLVRHIPEFAERNGLGSSSRVWIEPKASGLSLVQTLREFTQLNVMESPSPKSDKLSRVQGISATVESGRVLLPETSDAWVERFLEECSLFPNAEHDDLVDCLCMAIEQGRNSSVGFLFKMMNR